MKIATWNINGIRARTQFLRSWLEEHGPDVLCLQETKADDDVFPTQEVEAMGYRVSAHGQKAYNGVAVLSKDTHEVVQVGLPGQQEAGARLLHVRTLGVDIVTVYCPNGKNLDHPDFALKLDWYDAIIAYAAAIEGRPRLVMGDFNIVPAPIDSWNEEGLHGEIFHTDEERDRFARLLDTGLHDVWRDANPDEQEFSWWDYRGPAFRFNRGLRIDFVLAGGGLQDAVQDAMIDRNGRKVRGAERWKPSDHAPVVSTFAP